MIKLTQRLEAIKNRIKPDGRVIDVGTDHGMLPVYLIERGLARHVTATDINPDPLDKARKLAAEHGLTDSIDFVLTDGLVGVSPDADTVVIAGMGGETMIGILAAAPWLRGRGVQLILQPQSKQRELTVWLGENGYNIIGGSLVRERDKYYVIIEVSSIDPPRGMDEYYILRLLCGTCDPTLPDYIDTLIKRQRYIVGGLEKSAASDQLEIERNRLSILENIKGETEKW